MKGTSIAVSPSLGIPPRVRAWAHFGDDLIVRAGVITILIASISAPVLAAFADANLRGREFFDTLLLREVANLSAALAAIVVMVALVRQHRSQLSSTGLLLWIAGVATATFGLARLGMQLLVGVVSLDQTSVLVLTEFTRVIPFWGILFAVFWLVRQRVQLVNAQTILLNEAHRALNDGQEALRSRVFDHLHGTVTSELVVARARLNDIADDTDDADLQQRLHAVASHIQRIHELEVRQLAHTMVASGLDTSLDVAVRELAESCSGLCEVALDIDPEFDRVDRLLSGDARAELRLTLYRIIEECLANALRHAHAQHVDISVATEISASRAVVRVQVVNDGEVPSAPPPMGVGLSVVRARAASRGGDVQTSVHDGKFFVQAQVGAGLPRR